MREGRELATGGTIEDRIPDRPKPENIEQALEKVVQDWDYVMAAYKEEREETPTYMQMYAMDGAIVLVQEFQESLTELSDFIKSTKPEEPAPGTVPAEGPYVEPRVEEEEPAPPPPKVMYSCRANHEVDEETAKALNLICPKCRMLLRRIDGS